MTAVCCSVFSVVEPRPGKCFVVVATPPSWYPHTWAVTRWDTTVGLDPNERPSIGPPTVLTSLTGARLVFTPSEDIRRPVFNAVDLAHGALPWNRIPPGVFWVPGMRVTG